VKKVWISIPTAALDLDLSGYIDITDVSA